MPIDIDVQSFAELNNNVTDINNKVTPIQNMVLNAVPAGSNNKISVKRGTVWNIEGEEAYNGQFQELGNISGEVVLPLNTTTSRTAIIATITGYTFVTSFGDNMLISHVYTIFLKQNSTGNYAVRWPYGASVLNMVGPDPNQITAVYVVKLPNGKIFVKCEAFQNTVEIGSVLAEIEKPLILYPTQEDLVSRSFEWKKSNPSFYGTVLSSVSSDWEVAKDELFSELIFSSYNNLVEVFSLFVRVQWVGLLYFRTRYNGSIDGLPSSSLWSLTFSRLFGHATEKDLPIFGKLSVVEITKVLNLAANVGVAVAGSGGGLFTIASDGAWTFDPDGDFAALEGSETADTSVTYHASDGVNEASATLTVTVSSGAVETDQYWDNVSLLIQPEIGAANGSAIVDYKSHPLVVHGNTSVVSEKITFDGNGDYITSASDPAFDLSASDFTLECVCTPTLFTTGNMDLIQKDGVFGSSYSQYTFRIDKYGKVGFGVGSALSSHTSITGVTTLVAGTTYHLAVTCSGTTISLFVNGILDATRTKGAMSDRGRALYIGYHQGQPPSSYFNGTIRAVRITKGIARYTANFTPPTLLFPTT